MSGSDDVIAELLRHTEFDSMGQITLDARAQVRKLGESWGSSLEQLMLLAVQLTHAADWSAVRFDFSAVTQSIHFQTGQISLTLNQLHQELKGQQQRLTSEARQLLHQLQVTVLACCDRSEWRDRGAAALELRLYTSTGVWWQRLRHILSANWGAELKRTLTERCCLARLSITANGERLNSGMPEDHPILAFNPSAWTLQPEYYENGPWAIESYRLTDAKNRHSLRLASRGARSSDACWLNDRWLNCTGPVQLHSRSERFNGRLVSSLTHIEGGERAQVVNYEIGATQTNPDLDVFRQLDLTRKFLLGSRSTPVGNRRAGTRLNDWVLFADGLESCLSPLSNRVSTPPLTRGPDYDVAGFQVEHWLGLRATKRAKGLLFYVRHGVLLDPISFDCPLPMVGIRSGHAIKTDLSALRAVEDATVQQDIAWVRQGMLQLVALLRNYQDPGQCPLGRHFPPAHKRALRSILSSGNFQTASLD